MGKRKVSVIVNFYNGEKYIENCIKSILKQNYDNFEIILWDNNSKDRTQEIIKNFHNKKIKSPGMMKKHYSPGIPVFINQKKCDKNSAFIYLGKRYKNNKNFFSLSERYDLKEAASNLYKIFRLIKKKGYKKIQIALIPKIGAGIAINDRIKKASNTL